MVPLFVPKERRDALVDVILPLFRIDILNPEGIVSSSCRSVCIAPSCLLLAICLVAPVKAATVSIQPASLSTSPSQTISLNVYVSGVQNLYGFDFDVNFNPSVLFVTSVIEGPFLPTGGDTTFSPGVIDNVGGGIDFIGDSLNFGTAVSGDGVLATITFTTLALGTSAIDVSNVQLLDPNFYPIPDVMVVPGSVSVQGEVVPESSYVLLVGIVLAWIAVVRHVRFRIIGSAPKA